MCVLLSPGVWLFTLHVAAMADLSLPTCPRGIPRDGLYTGSVLHKRHRPKEHEFQYGLYMALLDTKVIRHCGRFSRPKRLTFRSSRTQTSQRRLDGMWPLTGFNRPAIASLLRCDHAKSEDANLSLDEAVSRCAAVTHSIKEFLQAALAYRFEM